MFAFTPIAFMIMRGVVQGIAPQPGRSRADAARQPRGAPSCTVTLPLLKPGLANAFLVGFIESMADFGNPVVVGGQFSVLSTEIFFAIVGAQYDQGRAASLAWMLTLFALACSRCSAACWARRSYTTVTGKGDAGMPMPLPAACAAAGASASRCRGWRSRWWSTCSPSPAASCRPGAATTRRRWRTSAPPSRWSGAASAWCWAGTAWNSFFTTLKLAAISAPLTAALGLLIAWLLARTQFRGQGAFEFARAAGLRDPRHGAGRELHPGLQRAAVRADRHRR